VSLTQAYLALAAFFMLSGWLVFSNASILHSFQRDRLITFFLLMITVAWFGWQIHVMPEPDLAGLPRNFVFWFFISASLLSYFTMPDLLAIRVLGVLMLFTARQTLDAGYRQLPYSLLDATLSYLILVIFGLWWAMSPGVFYKQHQWISEKPSRYKFIGIILIVLSLACLAQIKFIP
jgi:hypothetical protein